MRSAHSGIQTLEHWDSFIFLRELNCFMNARCLIPILFHESGMSDFQTEPMAQGIRQHYAAAVSCS